MGNRERWLRSGSVGNCQRESQAETFSPPANATALSPCRESSTTAVCDYSRAFVLRAHTQLRKVLKDIANSSGLIEKQEVTAISQEGNSVKLTRTASRVSAALPEGKLKSIYEDKPTFAAEYLPSREDDSDQEGGSSSDAGNGTNGNGEIGGSDPIRFGN